MNQKFLKVINLKAIEAVAKNFAKDLVSWQKKLGRHHLPWQRSLTPYHVWLSEVMLQQTQVATVIDYYERFLKSFPNLASLAAADVDDVLALWSGLGYYSRARNLHRCAQIVVQEHAGQFPNSAAELIKLPGVGRSTSAAIAAFCFNEKISIFDGNVKRVLTRVLAYDQDISTTVADKELWTLAQTLLPDNAADMPSYTQGLMDLGATLCQPKQVQCNACPMQEFCLGLAQGRALSLPYKTKKLKRTTRMNYLLWLESPLGIWLSKRPSKGVWGGLFSMPAFDSLPDLERSFVGEWQPLELVVLPQFKHVLTHFDWMLQPVHVRLTTQQAQHLTPQLKALKGTWFSLEESLNLGLPKPIRDLLAS